MPMRRSAALNVEQNTEYRGIHKMPCAALKDKVFYVQEPQSGESTTTECAANYQLLVESTTTECTVGLIINYL